MCDSSDSAPMSDNGSICGPSSPPEPYHHPGMEDLMLYGMAAEILTADAETGAISRKRVAPEDFVIMRGGSVAVGDPVGVAPAGLPHPSVWETRWGPIETSDPYPPDFQLTPQCQEEKRDLGFWSGYLIGVATMIMVWAAWGLS